MSKQNWWIAGTVTLVIVIIILIVALLLGNAEMAQRERSTMNEKETAQDQKITSIEQNQDAQGKELVGLQHKQEIDRLEVQHQQDLAEVKAQGEFKVLEIKLAGIEKDVSEIKDEIKDRDRYSRPRPPYRNYSEVSFLVAQSGYYEFTIIPSNVEVFIDEGQSLVSRGIIYLTYGQHKYWSNSPVRVTIRYCY